MELNICNVWEVLKIFVLTFPYGRTLIEIDSACPYPVRAPLDCHSFAKTQGDPRLEVLDSQVAP